MAKFLNPYHVAKFSRQEDDRLHLQYSLSDQQQRLELLNSRSKWLVVMQTVVIHARAGSEPYVSGLFGLLGDAPVQVVDVFDFEIIEALYRMAEQSEESSLADSRQDLFRRPAEVMRQQLAEILERCYNVEQPTFELRPAIMFRLCPFMCNATGDDARYSPLPAIQQSTQI